MFCLGVDTELLFVYYKNIKRTNVQEGWRTAMTNNTTRKRYRIKNRVRFASFIVISLLLVCTIFNTALGFNDALALSEQQYIEIQVESGDTLWTIADEYMPDDIDIREAVYMICETNDVNANTLYAGQILNIPVL